MEAAYWLSRALGIVGGLSVSRIRISENMTIQYDPAFQGYQKKQETLDQQLNYLSPQLSIAAKWKGIGLQAGLLADFFLFGRSQLQNTLTKTDGTNESERDEARLDVQDQQIFLSADGESVIADFSATSLHNHGANPIVLSAFAKGTYTLWQDKASPFLGISWYLPLQAVIRSRNTRFGIRNFLETPYADDINQGTLVKSFAVSIGYQF